MKLTLIFNVLTLSLLAVLLTKVHLLEAQLLKSQPLETSQAMIESAMPHAEAVVSDPVNKAYQGLSDNTKALTSGQLKLILRAELNSFRSSLTQSQANGQTVGEAVVQGQGSDDTQIILVDQELDYYIEQGVISPQEMISLQHEIAKLDPSRQKQVMRKLVRAMNSGQLDGHL